jgi:pSer/pThr/pTyr-binding forkhead associated (FHA) protein
VPEPAFKFLEYVFLALLYLFFLRVLRAVWVELKEPRLVAVPSAGGAPPAPARQAKQVKGPAGPPRLVVVGPGGREREAYVVDDELTVGRGPGSTVPLTSDNFVSHLHARVFRLGDEYWVEDLGSTNGTLLNGRRVFGAVPLRKGDRVQVGRTVLELRK